MKTTLCLISLAASLGVCHAQYECGLDDCQVAALAYTTPVVYEMPVVYEAPVAYYAPVYYIASAAAAAAFTGYDLYCSTPSTVIYITGGRGTFTYSNCGNYTYESVVVYIGGGGPVSSRHRYSSYW